MVTELPWTILALWSGLRWLFRLYITLSSPGAYIFAPWYVGSSMQYSSRDVLRPLDIMAGGTIIAPDKSEKCLAGAVSTYAFARFRRGCVPSPAFFASWLRFFA